MKKKTERIKILFFFLSVFFVKAGAAVAQDLKSSNLTTSTVQIVDYLAYGRVFKEFDSKPHVIALVQLISIVYDPLVGRRWENELLPTAQKRWIEFKKYYQLILPELFLKIENLESQKKLDLLKMELSKDENLSRLQKYLTTENIPFYLHRVKYLDSDANSVDASEFNFSMSALSIHKKNLEFLIFGQKIATQWTEKEYPFIYDLNAYRGGFFQEMNRNFLLWDSQSSRPVLNVDVVKSQAMKFANIWKSKLAGVESMPLLQTGANTNLGSGIFNFEALHYLRMKNNFSHQFKAVERELSLKLFTSPTQFSAGTFARFQDERARGQSPEEVYQYVAYENFMEIARLQAQYFIFANQFRKEASFLKKVIESGVFIQQKTDPVFFLIQLINEYVYEAGSLFSPFFNKQVSVMYLYENIKAILGRDEYIGQGFSQLEELLLASEVFDAEFMKENMPEAFQFLSKTGSLELREFRSLNVTDRIQFWNAYLGTSKVNRMALVRLSLSLVSRMTKEQGRQLADHIHKIRESDFLKK